MENQTYPLQRRLQEDKERREAQESFMIRALWELTLTTYKAFMENQTYPLQRRLQEDKKRREAQESFLGLELCTY